MAPLVMGILHIGMVYPAALLALAAFAGWRLCLTRPTHYIIVPL